MRGADFGFKEAYPLPLIPLSLKRQHQPTRGTAKAMLAQTNALPNTQTKLALADRYHKGAAEER